MENNPVLAAVSQPSLTKSARRGVLWLTGSRVAEQGMTFGITVFLARLLTPNDYGMLGMATLLLVFLGRFADLGTAESIVQMREIDDQRLSSIFWFNIAFGLLFGVITWLLAPWMARFFQEPGVQPVIAVLAITLPLQSLNVVPEFLLRRRMQFHLLVVRNLVAILLAGAAGVVVALSGGGVWALVTQQVAAPLIGGVAIWVAVGWRPRFHFQHSHIAEIKDFTTGVLGFNILNFFGRNIDYLLIGRFLTSADLGMYTLAYRLMRYPTQFLSSAASQTLFPVFSRMQEDRERINSSYLRVARTISLVAMPVMVGMAITANDFVLVLFGPKWAAVAPLLAFLALAGVLQPVTSIFTSVTWALGLSQWQLRYAIVQTAIVVIGFLVGLQWGLLGMAASFLVTALISNAITIFLMFPHCSISRKGFLSALALPALASAGMSVAVLGVQIGLNTASGWAAEPLFRLVSQAFVGATVYATLLLWQEPTIVGELRANLLGTRRAKEKVVPQDTPP